MPTHLVNRENQRDPIIALVGSPNSGKTSLYNWLTGSKFKTVNYPGATVDCFIGPVQSALGSGLRFMDTPGTYSLLAKTPDEEVTTQALFHAKTNDQIDAVLVVIDATQIRRQLLIVEQVIRSGFRCVVAITMMDLLRKKGMSLDIEKLSQHLKVSVVSVEARLGGNVQQLINIFKNFDFQNSDAPKLHIPTSEENQILRKLTETILKDVFKEGIEKRDILSETLKIDKILLHRVYGPLLFLAVMTLLFTSIFFLAAPLMDLIDQSFSAFSNSVLGLPTPSLLKEFIGAGILPSFGAVLVFVPQIFILFLGIGILEDTGYLARAATLIDRPFSKIGLSGRSFVPLLSGFACAVPAMMATRNISSAKERWIVLFILPLMTCSARLPVYALLISFLFHGKSSALAGMFLAGIYLASILLGSVAAAIIHRVFKNRIKSHFALELPIYRVPQWRLVFRSSLMRTKTYLINAGPVIFFVALGLWAASSFPRTDIYTMPPLSQSYAALVGQWIEPVFKPMGLDWRVGVGLLSAFSAREVFVASLALVMNFSGTLSDASLREGLIANMQKATFGDGTPVFTTASVLGLIVFFMIAVQCMSTTATAAREWKSWKLAIFQLIAFNLLAYAAACTIVQVGRLLS